MIGIVVLNYETWAESLMCMESIRRTCREPHRTYLVDNASAEPAPRAVLDFLASAGPAACFLQAEQNRGYAAGNNLGIARALEDGCSIILVANSDIVFLEGAVQRLAECLRRDPQAGIAGPKVISPEGEVQAGRCSMKTGMKEIFQVYTLAKVFFLRKRRRYFCLDQDPERPAYAYHVSGCCFAAAAECAREVMPLDEGTVLYGEELILGIRMEQAGWRTRYEPGSVVVHRHGASSRKARPFMYECICRSELYYCARYLHAEKWQLKLLHLYRRALYLARCIRDEDMRRYWRTFERETGRQYREMTEQISK